MIKMESMDKWNYATAWTFFSENAVNRYIPETDLYIRSSRFCKTIDLRDSCEATEEIYKALKLRSLILMDGSSLNGKSTFAQRLAKRIGAEIVDVDLICIDWIEKQSAAEKFKILLNMNEYTDKYVLQNLERIVRSKSDKSVILVGSYMEVIYRAIISKTLGKYFEQMVSIYCCAKSFNEVRMMYKKRIAYFGYNLESEQQILQEYNYAKRLLTNNAIMLGVGMDASFVADIHVSDLFE